MKVLLSIKPQFAEKILSGEKVYEYRKRIFKKDVDTVLIYSTKPVGVIIGEFKIDKIIHSDKKTVWNKTKLKSGISKEFYETYFSASSDAYAIKVKSVKKYDKPIKLEELRPNLKAPQSYCYI